MKAGWCVAVWTAALLMVATPVVLWLQGWAGHERWPLRTLNVQGAQQRVDAAAVRQAIAPYAQRGFFGLRTEQAERAVAALPWVESVHIDKRWPDVLNVEIREHVPFARWGDGYLLSEQGRVFPVGDLPVPAGLPLLYGNNPASVEVKQMYLYSQALFASVGLHVDALGQDPRGSWSLSLSNGTKVLLGRQHVQTRMQRFAALLPRLLASQDAALLQADLRYPDGFALVWDTADSANTATPAPAQQQAAVFVYPPLFFNQTVLLT